MNVIVHLMFAVSVRKSVKKAQGISLNLPGFLFGNILPDISKKYGSYPHYMKDALIHVVDSKDSLIYSKSNKSLSPYRFAKDLGAMNHYLSDFFCFPHTEEYHGSKAHHGLYELTMIARYKKGLRGFHSLLNEQSVPLKPGDLKSFIEEQNKTYAKNQVSGMNDIRYALFAGAKLSESMITHSGALAKITSDNLLKVSYNA